MKIYSRIKDHETVLELWGASTKHPDSIFYFSEFKKCDYFEPWIQIYQWMLECASKLIWPQHAFDLTEKANYWYTITKEILENEK